MLQLCARAQVNANGTACKDVFTGLVVPYPAAGDSSSNASFVVSATGTVAFRSTGIQPASFAYSALGTLAASRFDALDVFAVLRTGNSSAWGLLSTDLRFIAFNQLAILAYQATNFTGTGNNCTTAAAIQGAIATYFAHTAAPTWATLTPAITSVLASCNVTTVTAATVVTTAVANAWTFYSAVAPVLGRSPQAINLPIFARFTSLLQASSLATLTGINTTTALVTALNSAAIVADPIGTYLGLAGQTPAVSATVAVAAVGPLTGVQITFWPYTNASVSNTTLAATVTSTDLTRATTTNSGAYFGFYVVPEGAVDVLLSPDPANVSSQVKTLAPFGGVVAFPNSTSTGVLTFAPIAALVNATWWSQQSTALNSTTNDLPVPTAAVAADWRAAYVTVLGSAAATIFAKEPAYNLLTRDYPAGGYTQAAVAVVDTLVPAIPGLGANFLYRAVNTSSRWPYRDVAGWIYNGISTVNSTQHSNVTFLSNSLYSVWLSLGGTPVASPPPPPPAYGTYPPPPSTSPPPPAYPPPAGRRRLQAAASITSVLTQVSTAIAASNSLITDQITTVSTAAAAGTAVNITALLTRLAQIAAVQQTDLATALNAVAARVAAGDLAGALTLATQAASDFSGTNLLNRVLAKQINAAAVNSIASGGYSPPPPYSDSSSNKKLALGLGLGLGLGIPLVIGAVAGVVYCIKARRAQQETAPAQAAAESVYYGAAAVASSADQLAAHYRARVGSSSTAV